MVDLHVRTVRIALSVALVAGLGACTDRPTEPQANPNAPSSSSSVTQLQCVADVRAKSVACGPLKSKANADATPIVLGGQGTYVQLTSSNVSYNAGTSVFQADLTVQNLTAQKLGTTSGTDTLGVRVFINSGPFGTGGTVTSFGDSVGTFTQPNQHYVVYPQILDAFGGTSSPRTWRFNVPSTVQFFVFTVLVSTPVPERFGFLRWDVERGFANYSNQAIWGADSRNVFSFGSRYDAELNVSFNTAERFDGAAWHSMSGDFPVNVWGAWGTSASDVWAVGDGGAVWHYDGATWANRSTPVSDNLTGVWGSGPNDVWVVGGASVVHYDGSAWTQAVVPNAWYTAIGGTASNNVYVAGDTGVVIHFNGTAWTQVTLPVQAQPFNFTGVYAAGTDAWVVGTGTAYLSGGIWAAVDPLSQFLSLNGVTGTSSSNVVAAGISVTGGVMVRWNAATHDWATIASDSTYYQAIWTSGPNDIWGVGDPIFFSGQGAPHHWDGTSLTAVGGPSGIFLGPAETINATFGVDASHVWAVGSLGQILRNAGNGWQQVGTRDRTMNWNGVWGTADNDIWIVGDSGRVRHWDGTSFTPSATGTTDKLNAVYGFSPSNVYTVSDGGLVLRYTGTGWGQVDFTDDRLNAIWGSSSTDIWAVGRFTMTHFNGSVWSQQGNPNCVGELFGVGRATDNPYPVLVGDNGSINRYDGDGWTVENGVDCSNTPFGVPTTATFFGVQTDGPADHMMAVGSGGTMLRFTGATWAPVASGVSYDIRAIWMSAIDNIYTAGAGGFIAHGHR